MEHADEEDGRKSPVWTIVGSCAVAVTALAGTALLGFTAFLSTQLWNHYQGQMIVDIEEVTKRDAALLQAQLDRRFGAIEKEIERLDSEVDAIRKP